MYRIRHKRAECIGCDNCTSLAPAYWELTSDGLASLRVTAQRQGDVELGVGFEEDLEALRRVEEDCPVGIISIEPTQTRRCQLEVSSPRSSRVAVKSS